MRIKIFTILLIIAIIVIGGVLAWQKLGKKTNKIPSEIILMGKVLQGKKIAMVIAFRDFRDEEYFIPKEILEAVGAEITTVSSSLGKAIGKLGGDTEVDVLLKDLKVQEYDVILFIGGPGAQQYFDDGTAHQIAKEAVENSKVLGAICIAPAILAKAGVLQGKKATVWKSALDKSAVKILEQNGAVFKSDAVVVDGKIITANGPEAAQDFAKAIIDSLK